jgi:hypothetical protein
MLFNALNDVASSADMQGNAERRRNTQPLLTHC